jgi:hypothetical protein
MTVRSIAAARSLIGIPQFLRKFWNKTGITRDIGKIYNELPGFCIRGQKNSQLSTPFSCRALACMWKGRTRGMILLTLCSYTKTMSSILHSKPQRAQALLNGVLELEKCNLVDGLDRISTWRVKEKCAPWSYEFCGLKIHVRPFTWQILCLCKHKYLHILVERHTCTMIFWGSMSMPKNSHTLFMTPPTPHKNHVFRINRELLQPRPYLSFSYHFWHRIPKAKNP